MRVFNHGVILLVILALPLAGCDRQPPLPEDPPQPQAPSSEAQAASPDVTADAAPAEPLPEALPQVDVAQLQQIIADSAAAGQILVIDYWATWCVPCVAMFPELHKRIKAMGDDVRIISVTLDSPGEYEKLAIEFLHEQHALKDAYLLDVAHQEAVVETFGERWQDVVVPAILVYDFEGRLAGEFVDQSARVDAIVAQVERLVQGDRQATQP